MPEAPYRKEAEMPDYSDPPPTVSQALGRKIAAVGCDWIGFLGAAVVFGLIVSIGSWSGFHEGQIDRHKYDTDHAFEVKCLKSHGYLKPYATTSGSFCANNDGLLFEANDK